MDGQPDHKNPLAYYMKGKGERTQQCSSNLSTIHIMYEVEQGPLGHLVCLILKGKGWLNLNRVIATPVYQVTLTWNDLSLDFIVNHYQVIELVSNACNERGMWITCRWPNLKAINHLKIHHSYA